MESKRTQAAPASNYGPAWSAAEADGMDMSLIELNLSKTHWERLVDHQRALDLVRMLQNAKKTAHGKPQ
jgi:hypothetical protein